MTKKAESVLLDTSALMAILLEEPDWEEVDSVIAVRPSYLPSTVDIEVGNALSKQFRRSLLSAEEVARVWGNFEAMRPMFQIVQVNVPGALKIVTARRMWAYDAYVVEAARGEGLPLLTRDKQQASIAALYGVKIL